MKPFAVRSFPLALLAGCGVLIGTLVPSALAATLGLPSPYSIDAGVGMGAPNQPDGVAPTGQPYLREVPTTPVVAAALPVALLTGTPTPPRIANTYVVTTDADTGNVSLRAAITAANANPGTDQITFNIPGGGVRTIRPTTALPTITQPVVIDGASQPGYAGSPLIEIDGSLIPSANGLLITGGNSTVRGLLINRFRSTGGAGFGIILDVLGGNVIEGNWIGINSAGTAAAGNAGNGIAVFGTSGGNLIGGTAAGAGNLVSGNGSSGIAFATGNAGGNIARGNWAGLNAAGTAAIPNGGNGIFVNAPNCVLGGTVPGSRNLVSGNTLPGIFVGMSAASTIIQGNWIGTDAAGSGDLGNVQNGISIDRASNTTIGGNTPEARNVIAGNEFPNIYLLGPATGTKIQGNYIGTDATGTIALGDGNAVVFDNAANNQLGGPGAGEGNLLSGNMPNTAVVITNAGATGNLVRGNRIGTNVAGTAAIPNFKGVLVANAASNVIGGPAAGDRNLISGNETYGIEFRNANNSRASGNYVGTDVTGTLDLGNKLHGIVVIASNDTIGGTTLAHGNWIAFNGRTGVFDSTGTNNLVRFNKLWENRALGIDLFPRGIVANDSLDNDAGANGGQNFPIMDSTSVLTGTTRIYGRLDSRPSGTYTIDFYASAVPDTAHFGEGKEYISSINVSTDASGRAVFVYDPGILIPDELFVAATATDAAGNTSEFSQTLCLADRDKDGIRDCWETPGWPIDIDSDGKYDLDLYARGARPDSIDIFVEIDAMNGYAPPAGMIPMVKAAFSKLPKAYLNAGPEVNGIALHAELSHLAISDMPPNLSNRWPDFWAVRKKYFGDANEIADANSAKILRAKSMFFRYGVWARTSGASVDTTWSGYGEGSDGTGGDEFVVTFGSTGPNGWNSTQVLENHAGTFMHEMGHTLGLKHGGSDHLQYKPNYYSVMNYTWQTPKTWQMPNTWRLDYSRAALPTLNEANLNEPAGLGAPANVWPISDMPYTDSLGGTWYASLKPGADADWTDDGYILPNRQVDINLVGNPAPTPGESLVGYQDWQNLVVNFRNSVEYTPAGVTPQELAITGTLDLPDGELTPQIQNRLNSIPPPKPKGIFVMDGQRDPNSMLVASNAGVNLYAAYRVGTLGGQLYLAADGAQAGRDVAILLAKTPGAMRPAPLGKSGTVASWDALLARRGTANTAEWQDRTGTPFEAIVVDSAGTFLEGVVRLESLLGQEPATYSVALAAYGAAPGGTLLAQAPSGDGNGNVEANEWVTLATSNVGVPGVPGPGLGLGVRLSNARPNPSYGASSVRLSLPAAADVVATVQDVAGRTVATLVHGRMGAGEHVIAWNQPEDGGRKPAAGVYFIVVRALGEQRSSRVVVLP